MKKGFKIFIFLIIIVIVGFLNYRVGFFLGRENILQTPPAQISNSSSTEELGREVDFSVFWEAWRKLETDFLKKDQLDEQKMIYGAIKGMIETIDDPYTTFFNPQETNDFEEELSGKYQGVGMEVAIRDEIITVVSPLEGTPAQKAGLRPNDKILSIDGAPTDKMSLDEAVSLIRGPKGTEVVLLIGRDDWQTAKEIILQRTVIIIPTFSLEFKETPSGEKIAYIKMYQFNRILLNELTDASGDILRSSAKKIILDLRNNPGGYLDVAQNIAGWFLDRGETIVWQDLGQDKERKEYKAQGPSRFADYPMVVLINNGSASASEILAGALRDNRGIKLVGEKSFGKGSVQEQIFLGDNSSLKITIAKWLTPKGYSIDEKGLEPDIVVEMSGEDYEASRDPQFDEALKTIDGL